MPQEIAQGDIFGRIGKAFGEGAGEQLGRERIAGALKQKEGETFDPLKKTSELARAGATPQEISSYLPLIQQQQARSQIEQKRKAATGIAPGEAGVENIPDSRRQESDYLVPKSREDIRTMGEDLFLENPARYPTLEEGIKEAQQIEDSRLAKEKAYEQRVETGRTELQRERELFLQKSGNEVYKDSTGELIGEFENLVKNDIDNGKNPKNAAHDRGLEMLELAKARQQVSLEGIKKMYQTTPAKSRTTANNLRQDYKKADQLPLFQKDLVNKIGMKPEFASIIAFPISEHKEIIPSIKSYSKNPYDSYEKISKSLGKNDSLLAIAVAIEENAGRGKGQQFLDRISADKKAGKLDNLTERHARELGETFDPRPSLTDLYYTSIFGHNKAGI